MIQCSILVIILYDSKCHQIIKHDKRRMRAQEQCFVRSVVLVAHDLG